MVFQVLPLNLADFDTLIADANAKDINDDLVAQPVPLCWPVHTRDEARGRLTFHMRRQKHLEDSSVRFMKVVDVNWPSTADGEIVSIARWHRYANGYDFAAEGDRETWRLLDGEDGWPEGLNVDLHNFILSSRDSWREGWICVGTPCWMLMHLVTRKSRRGQGAAGMLIEWGLEQAGRDGWPAFLEAGAMGREVYLRHGFEQVGELMTLDLRGLGWEGDFVMAKMVWEARRGRGEWTDWEGEIVVKDAVSPTGPERTNMMSATN